MQREINGRPIIETARGPVLTPCAPGSVLARLGDKWAILVVSMLALSPGAPMRFGAIRRGIPDISQRMLTLTLRNLERDGLVVRYYYPEVPPRVEYELTTRGKSMLQPLAAFTGWIRDNWQDIEASRQAFDDAEQEGTKAL
ncbi:transcriptional regulator [Sinorhizobium medicae]|uniref:Transcriptional regulator n=1 Tax=Sinorhizobium medicae TaxID=110321 RepID=A0ABX4TAA8_9HYPH|nr:helix-turn-helix domain-containing protein [Sinorhizobium medicae]PLT91005.1 transcriptional regulator [Sinorhizobium medicae]PLU00494.1 transcriptional regulator [Sinorhizobium medicae]PLU12107.1 transcriptional regulator [Sinorhizobium medicae]PLU16617.1 transcriptional regulator [Sinorhizobium medicae]PLU30403.1 transcriptional regulator [Sinorhizobium medicae]